MSEYNRKEIINKAKTIKNNVSKTYNLGLTNRWCYYICKAIVEPKTQQFKGVKIDDCQKVKGSNISRQIFKTSYMDIAARIIRYVERENRMPTTVTFTTQKGKVYHINIDVCTDMFSRILTYYDTNKAYPKYANISSKVFTKPTATTDSIYDYFVKTFGKVNCIDDALDYIAGRGYAYYYDDTYSNKTSIDRVKQGLGINCTDATQMMKHVADGTGKYESVDCIHVLCRGGDGHVYLRLTNKDGTIFYRDPAAVLDSGDITHIWCSNGTVLAINPSWWIANLNK